MLPNLPAPVAKATCTPSAPNPTMSASPSPLTSARVRGYGSLLVQPPRSNRTRQARARRRRISRLLSPRRRRRHRRQTRRYPPNRRRSRRPGSAGIGRRSTSRRHQETTRTRQRQARTRRKPPATSQARHELPRSRTRTMSARLSPFTSPSVRGYRSFLVQPPDPGPKDAKAKDGAAKDPSPSAIDTDTPACPKPTMSAKPSPFTSANARGYWSLLVQPPAFGPKNAREGVAGPRRPGQRLPEPLWRRFLRQPAAP